MAKWIVHSPDDPEAIREARDCKPLLQKLRLENSKIYSNIQYIILFTCNQIGAKD